MLGIGCFVIEKMGCGWCCGVFHEKNWVGLGVGVSNCKKKNGLVMLLGVLVNLNWCWGWGLLSMV